jgi:hypothetical protein
MRSEEEILARFRDVYSRTLESRTEEHIARKSINCKFNSRFRLKKFGLVGFCTNPTVTISEHRGAFVCNDDDIACSCKKYECKHTIDSVRSDLDDIMRNPSMCGQEYPKLAMLLWFLQRTSPSEQSRVSRLKSALFDMARSVLFILSFRWI